MPETSFEEDELDAIIRELVAAERKVIFSDGNAPTKRNQKVREIIDRRAKELRDK
jgi:hypothetical protein